MTSRELAELDFSGLPGAELVADGLRDLDNQVESANALLVCVAAPRLRALGIPIPQSASTVSPGVSPEHKLYLLLEQTYGSTAAHARYNALIRRVVSFARAFTPK